MTALRACSLLRFFSERSQQFVRDNVLHVDDGGDEEEAAAQRDLRQCPIHEMIDRTLNDAERDNVFEAIVEEDDKVSIRHCPVVFWRNQMFFQRCTDMWA